MRWAMGHGRENRRRANRRHGRATKSVCILGGRCSFSNFRFADGDDLSLTRPAQSIVRACCFVYARGFRGVLCGCASPLRILTAPLGVFKSPARNSTSASLARPSMAGAWETNFLVHQRFANDFVSAGAGLKTHGKNERAGGEIFGDLKHPISYQAR